MNTNASPTNQKALSSLRWEYEQRLKLAAMSDKELLSHAVTRLRASYEVNWEPFHPHHSLVDLVREECDRRDKPRIFDKAFEKI